MRLVSGNDNSSGRVEVNFHGTWGTVCDDKFNKVDGLVVCKQLGFFGVDSVQGNAYYGQGKGPIFLDDVDCIGSESSIVDCRHLDWGKHNCDHNEDVGVSCISDNTSRRCYYLYVTAYLLYIILRLAV